MTYADSLTIFELIGGFCIFTQQMNFALLSYIGAGISIYLLNTIEYNQKLMISSQFSIVLSAIITFLQLSKELAVISYLVSITSILHWRYPLNKYFRYIDLLAVFGGFLFNLRVSVIDIIPIFTYLLMTFTALLIYRCAFTQKSYKIHLFLHIYGFIALIIQYYIILIWPSLKIKYQWKFFTNDL